MKDEQMENGQSMENLYQAWSRVSVLEDAESEGKLATRTLERFRGDDIRPFEAYGQRHVEMDVWIRRGHLDRQAMG